MFSYTEEVIFALILSRHATDHAGLQSEELYILHYLHGEN